MVEVSTLTGIYSIYLVVSASFMRIVLNYIKGILRNVLLLEIGIGIIFLIGFFLVFIYLLSKRRFLNAFFTILLFLSVILYTLSFRIVEERIHIFQFGLLGFLSSLDNFRVNKFMGYKYALFWVLAISVTDEIFQFYLPERVGDFRDVVFGFIGGSLGIILHLFMFEIGNIRRKK